MNNTIVYHEVIRVTKDYLGPAAERFIGRQVVIHLQKRPEDLTRDDLAALVDWIKISIALLTDDTQVVENFTQRLHAICRSNNRTL